MKIKTLAIVIFAIAAGVSMCSAQQVQAVNPVLYWDQTQQVIVATPPSAVLGWKVGEISDPDGSLAQSWQTWTLHKDNLLFLRAIDELTLLVKQSQAQNPVSEQTVTNVVIPNLLAQYPNLRSALLGQGTMTTMGPKCTKSTSGTAICTDHCGFLWLKCCHVDCPIPGDGSCTVQEEIPCPPTCPSEGIGHCGGATGGEQWFRLGAIQNGLSMTP